MKVGNQGATTRWDADGPNGPNTLPNSESVVLDWWTTGDNWSFYKGGKNANGKTITTKKENTWKVLSGKIKAAGIQVERNAKSVGAKLQRMEAEYKAAFDFVTNTGQGLMDEGKDITEYVKKLCPYYYVLHPIMADLASTKPIANFESEGMDVDEFNDDDDDGKGSVSEVDVDDENYEEEESVVAVEDEEEKHQSDSAKKRPLSLRDTKKKVAKLHPATELLNSLNVAVEKANLVKLKAKKDELEELKKKSNEDIRLKSRELDIMEKKVDQEVEKAKLEITMLEVQQKAELLLT